MTASALPAERVASLLESTAAAAAMATAARLGILERLDRGPVDSASLARHCRVSERGAELLLPALAGIGLVERLHDGSYRAAGTGLASLRAMFEPWEQLPSAVRDGRPAAAGDTRDGAESLYPDVVPVLGELFAPAAARAADLLASTGPRIFDVGAGAAPWTLTLVARDPARHVTAVDLPEVLLATRRAVRAAGFEPRFDFFAADMFADELPGEYDLVLAANVCHLFGEDSNERLVGRLGRSLSPGGTFAVVDILPNEDLDGPPSAVLYGLGLLLRTGTGRAYPFSAYERWLGGAGLEAIERRELSDTPPFSLITARHP